MTYLVVAYSATTPSVLIIAPHVSTPSTGAAGPAAIKTYSTSAKSQVHGAEPAIIPLMELVWGCFGTGVVVDMG